MADFSSGGLDFGDGSGGNDKRTRYLLIGGLALIFVGFLAFTIWYLIAPRVVTLRVPTDRHMFCVNCNKEVIVPIGQAPATRSVPTAAPERPAGGPAGGPAGSPAGGAPGTPSETPPPPGPVAQQHDLCPTCGKPLIPEKVCPKCKKYYVSDWDKTHGPTEADPNIDSVKCPYCGVNIVEYRNAHPYED